MTYINSIDAFNNVKKKVAEYILSEKKILGANNVLFGKECDLSWKPSSKARLRHPPNYRPLQCYHQFKGTRFTTEYEAKEFVSELLLNFECTNDKNSYPRWEINLKKGENPAFTYFYGNKIEKHKSLFIKFNLLSVFNPYSKSQLFRLEIFSFKQSEYTPTKRQKN